MIANKMKNRYTNIKVVSLELSAKIEKRLDEDSIVHPVQMDMLEMEKFAKKKVRLTKGNSII